MKHHGKRVFRATFQIVAITDSIFRLFIYTFLGLLTLKALKLSAVLIPPVLIGLFLGNKFHFVINQKTFYYMVMIILSLAATALILHSIF